MTTVAAPTNPCIESGAWINLHHLCVAYKACNGSGSVGQGAEATVHPQQAQRKPNSGSRAVAFQVLLPELWIKTPLCAFVVNGYIFIIRRRACEGKIASSAGSKNSDHWPPAAMVRISTSSHRGPAMHGHSQHGKDEKA